MLGGSTVYDIRLKYSLQDQATKGLMGMSTAADKAAKSTGGLGKALMGLAGAAVGFGAFSMGKKLLIDYNSQIDQMQIGLATVIGSQLHVPFADARKEADRLFLSFQEMAKKSPATTKDFVEMANGIARAVTQAGLGTEDLREMTGSAVVAAQAFGIRADMAALDIEQMLRGDVTTRDRMANALLGSMGTNKEAFNKMSQAERNRITKASLGQDSIKKASEAFGESFAGQMSTLQDQIEITFAQVGLPLVKEITKEVKKWNTWIERNPQKIKEFVQDFGSALVTGFNMIKEVATFLMDNKDALLAIAKAWLVFKGVNLVGGALMGGANSIAGLVKKFGEIGALSGSLGTQFSGLIGAIGGSGGVIAALGLLAGAAVGIYSWWKSKKDEEAKREKTGDFFRAGSRAKLTEAYDYLRNESSVLPYNATDLERANFHSRREKLTENLTSQAASSIRDMVAGGFIELKKVERPGLYAGTTVSRVEMVNLEKLTHVLNRTDDSGTDAAFQDTVHVLDAIKKAQAVDSNLLETLYTELNPPEATPAQIGLMGNGTKPEINVKIERIEVMSDDPDRFVHGMVDAFEDAVRNPTQAAGALRGIQG